MVFLKNKRDYEERRTIKKPIMRPYPSDQHIRNVVVQILKEVEAARQKTNLES